MYSTFNNSLAPGKFYEVTWYVYEHIRNPSIRTLRVTTVTLSIGSKALILCEEANTATVSLQNGIK